MISLFILVSANAPLAAQCADGSPPPCRAPAAPAARASLDPSLIAVFPFRVTGSAADAGSLREGAMDLLALALDEQAGLRVVPSRTLLARARTFTDASSVDDASAISRTLGAGRMILGNAIVVGGQVRARAELFDVAARRTVISVEARGAATDPAPVVDSLAFALARVLLASGNVSHRAIAEYATTSPAALRLYLAGEGLSRAGRWQEAADSLIAAVRLDTTFALAMYRLRVVNTYGGTIAPYDAGELVERAMRTIARLPRRQADLLQTSYALETGNAREAAARADALLARYPDDPEAMYEAGEALFHVGLAFGEPPQRALDAYLRAIALDSQRVEPYGHAAELRMMIGDTAGSLALARRGAAVGPSSQVHRATLFAARAIAAHEEPAALVDEMERRGLLGDLYRTAYECWRLLSRDAARALDLSGRFYELETTRGLSGQRASAFVYVGQVRTAQGRFAEAARALDDARRLDADNAEAARARLVLALMGGGDLEAADTALRRVTPQPGLQTLGLLGVSAARRGRAADLVDIQARLHAIAQLEPRYELYVTAIDATLRGLDALQHGDSTGAERILRDATGVLPYSLSASIRYDDVLPWGVLALARLEAAKGHSADAASRLDFFTFATGIVPARLAADSLRAQVERRVRP